MKLLDLEAVFVRYEERQESWQRLKASAPREGYDPATDFETVTGIRVYNVEVATLAEAHGVMFLCPVCFVANGGRVGTHSVVCWSRSRGVPEHAEPGPGRWALEGTSLKDLTLNADPPSGARSVALQGGCAWHGFVTNGEVTDA